MTIKELKDILSKLQNDSKVYYSSGEGGSLLYIESKNGRKTWSILKDGSLVRHS